jgi:hypothetical protein
MANLSRADIQQQYYNNVVLFKGVPVKVVDVYPDKTVSVIVVKTKKLQDNVPFNHETFQAPNFRLGMCTLNGETAYLTRTPVRKMGIGISTENISYVRVGGIGNGYDFLDEILKLVGEPVYNTIIGIYPNVEDAFSQASLITGGVVAFDRQMAVDSSANIYYKDKIVGKYVTNTKAAPFISFSSRYSFLTKILGCNYETTF